MFDRTFDILLEFKTILAINQTPLLAIIAANTVLLIAFIIGKLVLYKFENAVKFFSYWAVFTGLSFVAYFASILWFSFYNLYSGNLHYASIFLVFLFLPFIIGHFTTYEKIHFGSNIQILTLAISLLLAFSFV